MSGSNPWTWDPVRRAYYVYNQDNGLYVYQDGSTIDSSGRVVVPGGSAGTPRTGPSPTNVGAAIQSAGDPLSAMASLNLGGPSNQYPRGSRSAPSPAVRANFPKLLQEEPAKEITDPALISLNVQSRGRLRGVWKQHEGLFPGKKFFVRGKVIKVLWPELAGNPNNSVTVTEDTKYGEGIATKIRWFIVIKEGSRFCTCIPIVTYNGQGVAKPGVIKSQHAIAFSSRKEPPCTEKERPGNGEGPMLPGIRISSTSRSDKLHDMARIDFARTYTVEHNVKVYDFGMVAKDYMDRLAQQWIKVLLQGDEENYHALGASGEGTDDEEADEEEEEEEEEEHHQQQEEESDEGEDEEEDDDGQRRSGYSGRSGSGSSRRRDRHDDRSGRDGKKSSSSYAPEYRGYPYR